MITTRDLLATGAERLAAAGIESAAVDARLLLEHCLGVGHNRLILVDEVDPAAAMAFEEAVARRERREPLQHIVGRAPFRHIEVAVGPGVFVPRPETELLVDFVLYALRTSPTPVAVDLCSGTGAIALSLAHETGARVFAVEADDDALAWLVTNTAGGSVEVVHADIRDLDLLAALQGTVDAVISNPPYVPLSTTVAPEVRADPAVAVFAGPDGLDLLPAVVDRAAALLRPGGRLAFEHDESHAGAATALLGDATTWRDVRSELDLTGRPRYTVAIRD